MHCDNDLLTDLYKGFLKFKENVPKIGRKTNNSYLGTVCIICLGTYNLSKNLLIHWSIILTGSCYIWNYFAGVLLLYENFPHCNMFWKIKTEAYGLKLSDRYQK